MDSSEAKCKAIEALIAADNGSGGLNNSASDAYVRDVARIGSHPAPQNPPYLLLDDPNAGNEASLTGAQFDVSVVNAHFYVDRENDRDRSKEGTMISRFYTVVANITPAAQGTTPNQWSFDKIRWIRKFTAPVSDSRLRHIVVQLGIGATRG